MRNGLIELPARARPRFEWIDPAELSANPENPKFHPPEQLETIGDLFSEVGWAGVLLYNERTKKLLDGHGRKELLAGSGPAPVMIGDWSPAEERKIVAYLDATGYMAKMDARLLEQLRLADDLLTDNSRFADLFSAMKDAAELFDTPASAPTMAPGVEEGAGGSAAARPLQTKRPAAAETPDAVWPSDNAWGIPLLLPELQADCVEFPFTLWGTQGQTRAMRGTWHFYTADSAFESLWANPGKVFPSGAPTLVEPNFSTHDQTPAAVWLHGIYKRRWLARYWQSQGKRIFVDINVHHDLLEPHEATAGEIPAFLGVPKGWKAFATRAHGNRPEMLEAEHAACVRHAGSSALVFVVYGGGARVKEMARGNGWGWFPEQSDLVRGKMTDGDRLEPIPIEGSGPSS